jgi:hypothetical protein
MQNESPTKGLQALMQRLNSPSKAAAMNYIVVHELQVQSRSDCVYRIYGLDLL